MDALRWVSGTSWSYFDATAAASGVSAAAPSPLTSFQDTEAGGVYVYYIGVGPNFHVYELYWSSEGSSSETDLTAASGAGTKAAKGGGLSGVMTPAPND